MRNYINTFQDELETDFNTWWWTNQEVNNVLEEKNTFLFKWEKFKYVISEWLILICRDSTKNNFEERYSAKISYKKIKYTENNLNKNNFFFRISILNSKIPWLWSIILTYFKDNFLKEWEVVFLQNSATNLKTWKINYEFYSKNGFRDKYDNYWVKYSYYKKGINIKEINELDFLKIIKEVRW